MKLLVIFLGIVSLGLLSIVYAQNYIGQAEITSFTQFGPGSYTGEMSEAGGTPFPISVEVLSVATPTPLPPTATPEPPNPCPDTCYDIAWYCYGIPPGAQADPLNCGGPIDPFNYNIVIDDINRSVVDNLFYDPDGMVVFETSDRDIGFHDVTIKDAAGNTLLTSGVVPESTIVSFSASDILAEMDALAVDQLQVVCQLHPTMVAWLNRDGPPYF